MIVNKQHKENDMPNRIFRFMLAAGIVLSILLALPAQSARAAGTNRYVATTGVNSGSCTNSAAPCLTIAYAITQSGAASADLIHIATGTYHEYLTIDRPVSLIGAQENLTIIDGTMGARLPGGGGLTLVFVNSGVTATLQDLNVQNAAHPGGNGGGIYNFGTLSLVHVVVSGNTAMIGGGIFNEGSLSLSDVFISNNTASAGPGGGLFNSSSSSMFLTNVTLSNNTASGYSGGLHHQGTGMMYLTNVTFSNNTAHIGGAMTVTAPATAIFLNSTIANNHKDAVAGSAIGGIADYGTINMVNTILYGNDDANCGVGGSLVSLGYNIDGAATCLTPVIAQTTDHPNTNPLLGPLAKNGGYVPTFALLTGSPAIDAATPAYCTATDAASWHRPQDGNGDGSAVCDIGAFEAPTYTKFTSAAARDGWVLESTEVSNVGGSMNSAATTFRLGDDATKKQYRGILSFSTGATLPDTAVITGITLKVKKSAIVGGGNPVAVFKGFMADIKKGFFGTAALQTSDFQATASKAYGPFVLTPVSSWYSIDLTSGKAYINKLATNSGLTQIRLRFKLDDNNNATANYLSLFSGNAPAASQPQLIIQYYVP
jgi:hypothetical protein